MSNPDAVFAPVRSRLVDLARRACLAPVEIDAEFSSARGFWARNPVLLTTQIFRGEGALRRLQIAEVSSETQAMAALTVVATAAPECDVPVFGVDLVAFRARFVLAALDLSGGHICEPEELLAARGRLFEVGAAREVPSFAQHCFSQYAAIVGEDDSPLDQALPAAFDAYLSAFTSSLSVAKTRDAADGQGEHARYFSAMRANKRESKALGRIFGEEWAERFFAELFFAG